MTNDSDAATWTWWAAWYGAAVSSLALLWNIGWSVWSHRVDRGWLKIKLVVGRRIPHPQGADRPAVERSPSGASVQKEDSLFFVITNIGRRPITATKVIGYEGPWLGIRTPWFLWRRRPFVITPRYLPRTLQPTESVIDWMDDARLGANFRVLQLGWQRLARLAASPAAHPAARAMRTRESAQAPARHR